MTALSIRNCLMGALTAAGVGCGGGSSSPVTPPPTSPAAAPPVTQVAPLKFTNVTVASRVNFEHRIAAAEPSDPERISAGVASGDFDADGYVDLYVVGGDGSTPNLLFRNAGDGSLVFEEVGESAGVRISGERGSGPTFADLDGDGWLDLLILAVAGDPIRIMMNNGDGTFSDRSEGSGLESAARPNAFSAALADYDLDGDLDLALSHWDWAPDQVITNPIANTETLWASQGDGTFQDVSVPSLLASAIGGDGTDYTFTPNFADINSDGYPDLLFASDFVTSQVFVNNWDGTFTETTTEVISDENGMGASVGDYDNDGDLDWFVTAIAADHVENPGFSGNRLYRNDGIGNFEDVTDAAGVRVGGWGWGSCFGDFDNDGHLDLFHVNGWNDERFAAELPRLFRSDGNGQFEDLAAAAGIVSDREGRGVVCADFDRDGDLDIFIVNNRNFAELYRNETVDPGNWLNVQLQGQPPNTQGIGARVSVMTASGTQMREIQAGNNFVSQNPAEAHFGLDAATEIIELRVVWPDGSSTVLVNQPVNQVALIRQ